MPQFEKVIQGGGFNVLWEGEAKKIIVPKYKILHLVFTMENVDIFYKAVVKKDNFVVVNPASNFLIVFS